MAVVNAQPHRAGTPRWRARLAEWTPQTRARAFADRELRLCLRVHLLDALHLAVEQHAVADLRICRLQALFRALGEPSLDHRLRQPVLLQRHLRRARSGDRTRARHRHRPARAAANRSGARSSSIRSRSPSSVTGTVWSWLYSPNAGIEYLVRGLGWTDFTFRLTTDRDTAIYAIIATGVWQSSGFAMALFLAGLRSVDPDIVKAAEIDGASRFAHLSQGDPALDRADLHRGHRSCCCNSRSRPSISSSR